MEKASAIYFVSDFHLGTDAKETSRQREQRVIRFLDMISEDASHIYLLGDIFDYWFEYKRVIPKGYARLLGKLGSLVDQGVKIEFFIGNHDMWMFRYFEEELGIPIHRSPKEVIHSEKRFLIGHGDGLGPGDHGYKMIKRIFSNRLLQILYSTIHPNIGLRIMRSFSKKSRESNSEPKKFLGPENEWLVQYCEAFLENKEMDYFVFGHRHLPIDYKLSNDISRYINLGDWLTHYSYAKFTGDQLNVLFFENEEGHIFP